jgi:cyclic beta-1,2-glucan synthetase
LIDTLQTIQRMPRFRGHLYNWHDTRDLRVLDPAYVSSVDSGNLAGHLIAWRKPAAPGRHDPIPDDLVVRQGLATAPSLPAARLGWMPISLTSSARLRRLLALRLIRIPRCLRWQGSWTAPWP